jgi:hypothetical protein
MHRVQAALISGVRNYRLNMSPKRIHNIIQKPAGIGFPARVKIDRLKLSLNRAFINTIVPEIKPSAAEEAEWRTHLGISPSAVDNIECVYCGQRATQLDHFRSLTEKRDGSETGLPTGWVTDIFNLVPCCSTCNSSKAGAKWRNWMTGKAPKSPKQRISSSNLAVRVGVLDRFETWSTPLATHLKVLTLIGQQEWQDYEAEMAEVNALLRAARLRSERFHIRLQKAYNDAQAIAAASALGTVRSAAGPTT